MKLVSRPPQLPPELVGVVHDLFRIEAEMKKVSYDLSHQGSLLNDDAAEIVIATAIDLYNQFPALIAKVREEIEGVKL